MWNLITLDGYFEGSKAWDLDFHRTVFDKELHDFSIEQLKSADMLIFGEKTYQGMAKYWTSVDEDEEEVAKYMNKLPKIVCSTSLQNADWNNTTIVKDAVTEIPKIKRSGAANMLVFGSAILSYSLMKAGLFDEYRICIAPVFLGKGRRLFSQGIPYNKLKLKNVRSLKSGAVILFYSRS